MGNSYTTDNILINEQTPIEQKYKLISQTANTKTYKLKSKCFNRINIIKIIKLGKKSYSDLCFYSSHMQTVNSLNDPHITPIINSNIGSDCIVLQTPGYSHFLTPIPKDSENCHEIVLNFIMAMSKPLMIFDQIRILHGNIKPSNIFFNDEGEVVVSDYCLNDLRSVKDFTTDCSYYSPEELYNGIVTEKSDIFSFGCILYYILSGGNRLFHNTSARSIIELENLKVNKELKELLKEMLEYDYNKRINLKEIINQSSKLNNVNYIFDWPLYHDVIFKVQNQLDLVENSNEISDKEYNSKMEEELYNVINIYNITLNEKCLSYIINIIWQNYSYELWHMLARAFHFQKSMTLNNKRVNIDSIILNSLREDFHLCLNKREICDNGLMYVCKLLPDLNNLIILNISSNYITDYGLSELCKTITCLRSMEHLDISYNEISSKGIINILRPTLYQMPSLYRLDISNNPINDDGLSSLTKFYPLILHHLPDNVIRLCLSGMKLTNNVMKLMKFDLKYLKYLTKLELAFNNIDNDGFSIFSEISKEFKVIETIDFQGNPINRLVIPIVQCILEKHFTLIQFFLDNTQLTPNDLKQLEMSYPNRTFKHEIVKILTLDNLI